jgi:predicted DCC family thiol-disulfide oxidoreductase YuxK
MTDHPHILLFDGICSLCNNAVKFFIKHDRKFVFKFAQLQSQSAHDLIQKYDETAFKVDSLIYINQIEGKLYTGSSAVIYAGKHLSFPMNLVIILLIFPKFLRDSVYKYIAKNRYKWFGKISQTDGDSCLMPTPENKSRFL